MDDASRRLARLSPEKRELLLSRLRKPQAGDEHRQFPLSFEQERLWFLDQVLPGYPVRVAAGFRLVGALDLVALRRACEEITRRHDTLRTTFHTSEGQPVQRVHASVEVTLPVIDLRHIPAADRETEALQRAPREFETRFDLERGPLVRTVLVRLRDTEHVLFIAAHHIICDGWSLGVLIREIARLYPAFLDGKPSPLPELAMQYGDFVRWDRARFRTQGQDHVDYCKRQLARAPDDAGLPTDYPRSIVPTFRGRRLTVPIADDLSSALRSFSKRQSVTPFIVLLAALNALLHRYTAQDDVVIGCPSAGRTRAETEPMIGFFAGTLVLRTDLSGDPTFADVMQRARKVMLEARAHEDVPLAKIIEVARPRRDAAETPVFEVLLSIVPPLGNVHMPGVDVALVELDSMPLDLPLSFVLQARGDGFRGSLYYQADRFRPETAGALARGYASMLEEGVRHPETRISGFPLSPELEPTAQVARSARRLSTVAIASTFAAEAIEEPLRFWFRELALPVRIDLLPPDQVFQQLLDEGSVLARNRDGVNVVLLRLEDWPSQGLERTAEDFADALEPAAHRAGTPHLVFLCPSSAPHGDLGRGDVMGRVQDLLARRLRGAPSVHVIAPPELAALYPHTAHHGEGHDGGTPAFTPAFFAALATMTARKFHALRTAPPKVIVLDCDQTLWNGVCGEEGPDGVTLDSERLALQEFMVAQQQAGALLCLCSKNHEEDVLDVFARRPEMPLRREHLVAWRLNWRSKSENLRSLADELGLDLASFVFLDDDPVECAEVAAGCPEVLTLCLPREESRISSFLDHVWPFDRARVTDEDRRRTAFYHQAAIRDRLRREAPTLEAFLAQLSIEVTVSVLTPSHGPRVAQLTRRTTQFNATTRRRTESDVQSLLDRGRHEGFVFEVSDRFGDYGLVGVLIVECGQECLTVDTFLLSCRALGRRIEHRMLAHLGRIASERGLGRVVIPYVRTPKSQPAFDFLDSIDAAVKESTPEGITFTFATEVARTAPDRGRWASGSPRALLATDPGEVAAVRPDGRAASSALWTRVATELCAVDAVVRAVEAQRQWQGRPRLDRPFVAPRTATEQRLANIWAELLRVDRIGIDDDFFELGGYSLLATQLVYRVRQIWPVPMSLQRFLEVPTVAGLAALVEARDPGTRGITWNFGAEAVLDEAIRPARLSAGTPGQPRHILLTGATGFVGAFVLADLLQDTDASIHCLVRSRGDGKARERLREHLETFGLWTSRWTTRIIPVPGDLAQLDLGLGTAGFERLAGTIDTIYHVGAAVNFAYTYGALRASNVQGTREILRLAVHRSQKPVHYVSTLGVFGPPPPGTSGVVLREDASPDRCETLDLGYFQSKWVAEKLVATARDRGLAATIYRIGLVSGDSRNGWSHLSDLAGRLIGVCVASGVAPLLHMTVPLTPVDFVSRALVYLSRQGASLGHTFHLTQPQPIHWSEIVACLRDFGYLLRDVTLRQWQEHVERLPGAADVATIAAMLVQNVTALAMPVIDSRKAHEALLGSSIVCPPADRPLIERYVGALVDRGVLPAPSSSR